MIIDCHCHAGKGDGLSGPWDTDAPLNDYVEWCNQYGIEKTILFSVFHTNYRIANLQVGHIIKENPGRFMGFAFVDALRDKGQIFSLVKESVEKFDFCGIKVHKANAKISREICEVALKFKIPILYDPMGDIGSAESAISQFPKVDFIIPHLSSFSDDWAAQKSCISLLERYSNAYADTSGIRRFDVLKEAYERVGSLKLIFGSDGPWLHPGVELEKVYALNLNQQDQDNILFRNIKKLINKKKYQFSE